MHQLEAIQICPVNEPDAPCLGQDGSELPVDGTSAHVEAIVAGIHSSSAPELREPSGTRISFEGELHGCENYAEHELHKTEPELAGYTNKVKHTSFDIN